MQKWVVSLPGKICGCMTLNADGKSGRNSGGFQTAVDSVQDANWGGSNIRSVTPMRWFFMILSMAFITREVRATGFRALLVSHLVDGEHCGMFPYCRDFVAGTHAGTPPVAQHIA